MQIYCPKHKKLTNGYCKNNSSICFNCKCVFKKDVALKLRVRRRIYLELEDGSRLERVEKVSYWRIIK